MPLLMALPHAPPRSALLERGRKSFTTEAQRHREESALALGTFEGPSRLGAWQPVILVVPAKAGTHASTIAISVKWVPAFAGTTLYLCDLCVSVVDSFCGRRSSGLVFTPW